MPSFHSSATKRRRSPQMEYYDLLFGGTSNCNNLPLSFSSEAEKLIQSVEAEKIADNLFAGSDIFQFTNGPSSNQICHYDLLDPPIPIESRAPHGMNNLPLIANPLLSDYYMMPYSSPKTSAISPRTPLRTNKMGRPRANNRPNRKDLRDFDISTLKLDEPAPEVISELPNGHGVTIVGTRLPSGEVTTRIKYDRHLMLALSHSPFSLAQPENYPQIVHDMDEIIPVYPKRYIPREFTAEAATPSSSADTKSE
uniref:Uncharacterized protein n=1 Tax=Panagrolaimus superbus TaxID=310955 RepID=A0A914Z538_9BILA